MGLKVISARAGLIAALFAACAVFAGLKPAWGQTMPSKIVRPEQEPIRKMEFPTALPRAAPARVRPLVPGRRAARHPKTYWFFYGGAATEWDDNVFLDSVEEKEDFRFVESVSATVEHTRGDAFIRASNLFRMSHYADLDIPVNEEQMDFRASYVPVEGPSLGVRETFLRSSQGTGQSQQADRISQLGFNINNLAASLRVPFSPVSVLGADYTFELIDFHDVGVDDFTDRNRHRIEGSFSHSFVPEILVRAGYAFKDSDFKESFAKDSTTHEMSFQTETRHWNNLISWVNRVAYERKHFDEGKSTGKPTFTSRVNTIFSRKLTIGGGYEFEPQVESSRSDFRQLRSNRATFGFQRVLTARWSGYADVGFERQDYTPGNQIAGDPITRRSIDLYNFDTGVRYRVNSRWYLELSHRFLRRHAEFPDESYRNNVYSVQAFANW